MIAIILLIIIAVFLPYLSAKTPEGYSNITEPIYVAIITNPISVKLKPLYCIYMTTILPKKARDIKNVDKYTGHKALRILFINTVNCSVFIKFA